MKNNFKLIRTTLFVFSVLCFLCFLFSSIYFFASENKNTWVLSVSIALINFLLTNILSFINLIVLPKKFSGLYSTDKFSDRKDIILEILREVSNDVSIIKITGYPLSGKSELLRYLYKITSKKKYLVKSGIDKKLANKLYKTIGRVHYIDGEMFSGEIHVLVDSIKHLSYSKHKKTIVLLDNIYKLDNPYKILEILCSEKHKDTSVIYTVNYDDVNTLKLNGFNHEDIKEVALKYNLNLSSEEINNIYLSSNGNIGLISLILNNYNSQNYIGSLNLINDSEISLKAQSIIKSILHDKDIRRLAVFCATINLCENSFNLLELSSIMGYNVSALDMDRLLSTGLFFYKNNTYTSSDYISQIIRSIDYKTVSQIIPNLIKYYSNKDNAKATSILLLCQQQISIEEAEKIKLIISTYSLKQSVNNLTYLLKIGQVYKELNYLDFSLSEKHEELREEIIYQYINALIYIGDYKSAKKILEDNVSPKLLYTKADLAHLCNNYNDAIGLFTLIINNNYSEFHMAKIKLAHCYKHIGHFGESLAMLESIEKGKDNPKHIKIRAKTDSLSLYILQNDFSGLRNKIDEITSFQPELKDYQIATLKRYRAVQLAYDNQYCKAISEINEAIEICNKSDSRLRYNCYYVRGEINRYFNNYNEALKDFLQCYRTSFWNEDYNLRSMAVLSIELLEKYIVCDTPNYDIPQILKKCTQYNMPYNANLLEILLQNKIIDNRFHNIFDKKIFIIP